MAIIKPFAALRPRPELAAQVCELPYDVLSSEEARQLAADNPLSFLHVSKPEIDLPPDTNPYAPDVYAKGRENLRRLLADGVLRQDAEPCFHLYRQVMGAHSQTGLVAVASCEEYLAGVIKKHELTRPDKEDDRVRHIETLNAQTGPVFLLHRAVPALDDLFTRRTEAPPEVDFTAPDGVRHMAWRLSDAADIAFIESAFARIPHLYIADGHHRSAAAARVYQSRRGAGASAFFLAVIFSHHQLQILPYNRVVKDLNGLSPDAFLRQLAAVGDVTVSGPPQPRRPHEVSFYLAGRWHTLAFHPALMQGVTPVEQLDTSLLQRQVLAPLLGIANPRTSERLSFVGGIRGTAELVQLVDRGAYACAFSLFPTQVEDLMAVADAGELMPPKSTWFEPKLRDAMFCHLL